MRAHTWVADLIPGPNDLCKILFGHAQEASNRCFSLTLMFLSLPLTLRAMKKCPWVKGKKFKQKNISIVSWVFPGEQMDF